VDFLITLALIGYCYNLGCEGKGSGKKIKPTITQPEAIFSEAEERDSLGDIGYHLKRYIVQKVIERYGDCDDAWMRRADEMACKFPAWAREHISSRGAWVIEFPVMRDGVHQESLRGYDYGNGDLRNCESNPDKIIVSRDELWRIALEGEYAELNGKDTV